MIKFSASHPFAEDSLGQYFFTKLFSSFGVNDIIQPIIPKAKKKNTTIKTIPASNLKNHLIF